MWKQLKMASKFESDLQDNLDWDRKRHVDFNAVNTQLVSLDSLDNCGAFNVKMVESVLDEKSYFEILRLSPSSIL